MVAVIVNGAVSPTALTLTTIESPTGPPEVCAMTISSPSAGGFSAT